MWCPDTLRAYNSYPTEHIVESMYASGVRPALLDHLHNETLTLTTAPGDHLLILSDKQNYTLVSFSRRITGVLGVGWGGVG